MEILSTPGIEPGTLPHCNLLKAPIMHSDRQAKRSMDYEYDAVRERLEVPRVEERPGGEVVDWVGVDDCIGVVDDVGRNGAGLVRK